MSQDAYFRVTFVRPDGLQDATTGRATDKADAIRSANEALEHFERIGISDYLRSDGLTVEPPARLTVERVPANEAGSGFGLVITDPEGHITRK
ncbi:hypothetical protein ABKW28_19015 [Nocardioides sp. 31GB23]|uniref:hypothetical protein n=1 Tax=Nocardioides sp. 31GB23 TaxID=3156065 RepID=UPI0032AF89CD